MAGAAPAPLSELGRLVANVHAPSGPARAHCCLTDEQLQDAIRAATKKSANLCQLEFQTNHAISEEDIGREANAGSRTENAGCNE